MGSSILSMWNDETSSSQLRNLALAKPMKVPTIGIIGKTILTEKEEALLVLLGRIIARAGKTLIIVPAAGTARAVQVGVIYEDGTVQEIEKGVLGLSAHAFVYADERLLSRLQKIDPNISSRRNVTLLFSELEIELWIDAAKTVFKEMGLQFPD